MTQIHMILSRFLLLVFSVLVLPCDAMSQTPQTATTAPPVKRLHLGDVCLSEKLRGGAGVLKVDLCDRPYCGSTITDEPFIKRNYDRKRLRCEFKVVGNICRCVGQGKP